MTKEEKITHWRAVIKRHATSGLSAAAFCREHNLVSINSGGGSGVSEKKIPPVKNPDFFNLPKLKMERQYSKNGSMLDPNFNLTSTWNICYLAQHSKALK